MIRAKVLNGPHKGRFVQIDRKAEVWRLMYYGPIPSDKPVSKPLSKLVDPGQIITYQVYTIQPRAVVARVLALPGTTEDQVNELINTEGLN